MFANPAAPIVAEHVLAVEAKDATTAQEVVASLRRIEQKLECELSPVVGDAGFSALFSRAMRKSKMSLGPHEGLTHTAADADARLEEVWVRLTSEPATTVKEIGVAVIAHFFDLLATFIGDDLAFRMFQSVWPEATATARMRLSGEK